MRDYLGVTDKKNEIRLLFTHPLYQNTVVICVEGGSDIKLFRKLLSHNQIQLSEVNGKTPLFQVMEALSVEFPNQVLAICDADFDHLRGRSEFAAEKSIFMTDYHDIEIMMLNSEALNSYLCEFAKPEYFDNLKSDLLNNVLKAGYILGLLRWINAEEDLKLNFKGLSYANFVTVDNTSAMLELDVLLDTLIVRSNTPDCVNATYLKELIKEYGKKNGCDLQVCSGHDLTNIIAILFRQDSVSLDRDMTFRKVESAMRLCFSLKLFSTSELFNNLSDALIKSNINLNAHTEIA